MKLIVGLGNPGREYEKSRLNAGWIVIDALAKKWGCQDFREEKGLKALTSIGVYGGEKIILAHLLMLHRQNTIAEEK